MRVLCVAEKPSISKAISQILSGGQFTTSNTRNQFIKNYEFDYPQTRCTFTVTCVSGHLTAQDFHDTHRKWHSCDPFDLFDAPVETTIPADKKSIEDNLLTQARRSQVLMIWTDCDREGEHIGMEIARVCRRANASIRIKRARFSAIIAQQIHNAAQNPVELDRLQADAVEARIILDLKVGAAFTRLQTMTLQNCVPQIAAEKSVVSYGPCQFPTLGFVVHRYNTVRTFVREEFWYIYLSLTRMSASQGAEETKFNWRRNHLFDQETVMNLFAAMGDSLAVVKKVTSKTTKKWKPLPLTTVELQKAGSRLLKLAPKKVLDIAEKLYQKGFLSYPRTETDEFDKAFDHMALIAKQTADADWGAFATSLQQGGFNSPRKGKNNDKAHPPIHPTAHANNLVGDDKRVYEYITRRYLACCSKDAEGWQTTVEVECGGEEFTATGLVVKERNYLVVYVYEKWNGHTVPEFEEGEEFQPTICEVRQGETSKPNFLTEADLVTLMDKNGIGTDATIAQHIQTIVDRDYVIERMEGAIKYLVPSTLGIGLIEGYDQLGLVKSVSKPQMRRETERKMVQVCEGNVTKNDMITQALEQYKEMFAIVRREFPRVTTTVQRYLSGEGGGNGPGGAGNNGGGGGGGGGGGAGGGGGGRGGGGRGGGRGGGGRGGGGGDGGPRGAAPAHGRGTTRVTRGTAPAGRGRGRGGSVTSGNVIDLANSDDDDDPVAGPPSRRTTSTPAPRAAPAPRIVPAPAPPTRDPRQTSPIYMSPTWQAGPPPAAASTSTARPSSAPRADYNRGNATLNDDVRCKCNAPAIPKTVASESATKGKRYWTCETSGCNFFQWVEEPSVGGGPTIPTKRPYPAVSNGEPTGVGYRCECGQDALRLTTVREGPNQGRNFWKCAKRQEDSPCKYFQWDDEPPRKPGGSFVGNNGLPRSTSMNTGGVSGTCFKCGEEGHFANACTNPSGDLSSNKRSRSFGTNSQASGAECFKCKQIGHYSSSCPNGASSNNSRSKFSGGGGGAGSSDECFKCGKTGHWSTNCPGDGGGGGGNYSRKGSYSSSTKGGRGSKSGGSSRGTSKRGRGGKKSKFGAPDDF